MGASGCPCDATHDKVTCAARGVVATAGLVEVRGCGAVGGTLGHAGGKGFEIHRRSEIVPFGIGEENTIVLIGGSNGVVGGRQLRHGDIPPVITALHGEAVVALEAEEVKAGGDDA